MDQDPSSRAARVKFAVLDEEDLAVMSAHLQDALASATDMTFLPQTKRFAATVSRVDWSSLAEGRQERRRAGFHFERVNRVRHLGVSRDADGPPLQLLSVSFHPTSAPAGDVLLTFSGGAVIRLEVECLEAEMRDLCAPWPVQDCRRHLLDEIEAGG